MGGSASTPQWTADQIPDLAGKTALVTGGNVGIGYAIALELARHGATVIVAGRSQQKLDSALAKLKEAVPAAASRLSTALVDLASLPSVKRAAEELRGRVKELHILVNNAGVALPAGPQKTEAGLDIQIGTNHFGTFYLTELLLPLMPRGARIVNLSSSAEQFAGAIDWEDLGGAKLTSSGFSTYGTSKLFNALYARELHLRLRDKGIAAGAVHPGFIATDIQNKTDKSQCFPHIMALMASFMAVPTDKGALSSLYVATAPGIGDAADREAQWGPDDFNRNFTAVRPIANKQYTAENARRLVDETRKVLAAKGFPLP